MVQQMSWYWSFSGCPGIGHVLVMVYSSCPGDCLPVKCPGDGPPLDVLVGFLQ